MSHYRTSICTDEELLNELKKFGYDEVAPDVFERMKNDLSELVAKEQDDLSSIVENEQDPSERTYNDMLSQSSKFLSATSDNSNEWRTAQVNCRKTDSQASRKTKKKSHKATLRHLSDHDTEMVGLESSRSQITDKAVEITNSNESLEYCNMNEGDVLPELGNSHDKRAKINKSKTRESHVSRNPKIGNNTNEDKFSSSPKKLLSKESDSELNYRSKNAASGSNTSVAKIKNKVSKESKSIKSLKKIQEPPNTDNIRSDSTLEGVNEAFKVFNLDGNYSDVNDAELNNYKYSDINLNTSSTISSDIKKIKRKVLRRRNGRSVITEELVEFPSYFNSSYPESENLNTNKSLSSDDLSYKSNSSTGSVTVLSPESSIKSSPSTFSLSSRSTSLRLNARKKKSDPVAMYNYYKKFWDNFKPPGENTHDRLRWNIRDKMFDYHI